VKDDTAIRVGPYLVRLQANASSPSAMPLFFVFRGGAFVGKSISMPSESDCDWLARQNEGRTVYASAAVYRKPELRGRALSKKNGRPV